MDRFVIKRPHPSSSAPPPTSSVSSAAPAASSSSSSCTAPPPPKKLKSRNYNKEYIKLGFTATSDVPQLPLCFLCGEVLTNHCMKPSLLKRHLQQQHSHLTKKAPAFFEAKLREFEKNRATIKKSSTVSTRALEASYNVALLVAKRKKPHTIAEDLILPAAISLVKTMVSDEAANIINCVPLSNNTISRRIADMAVDIIQQVVSLVKNAKTFSLQLDESTDVSGTPQVLAYVRFPVDGDVVENILMCKTLEGHATGESVFNILNQFFTEHEMTWGECVSVCTDGAATMTGKYKGLKAKVLEVHPTVEWVHCIIHREALVAKQLSPSLNTVLSQCIKIINAIKSSPLKSRIFAKLCEDNNSAYTQLLLHTEVRWLSRGRALARLFMLRDEVYQFLLPISPDLTALFDNSLWLLQFAYLVDIFNKLNELNLALQGVNSCVMQLHQKVKSFLKKIDFWQADVAAQKFTCFPSLESVALDANGTDKQEISTTVSNHLGEMKLYIGKYFPQINTCDEFLWVLDPFNISDYSSVHLSPTVTEELIDLSCADHYRQQFHTTPLAQFWSTVKREYPALGTLAVHSLLPFGSTYLCEATFSTMCEIKSKKRNRLSVEIDLIVACSSLQPRLDLLCTPKTAQISH